MKRFIILIVMFWMANIKGGNPMTIKAVPFHKDLVWVNTDPITLEQLKGHVILLDFWTYCCINCMHVLPDLKYLEEKYKDQPFVVIGIHSPKFENEKDTENVQNAIQRYGIRHPVVQDIQYRMWQQYDVQAWPTLVLINAESRVVGAVSGEGHRERLDAAIRKILDDGRIKGVLAEKKLNIKLSETEGSLLQFPGKIEIDEKTGTLFISNSNQNQIWMTRLTSGKEAVLEAKIGSGKPGFRDGSFEEAEFRMPQGLALHDQNLYVADTENHAIRVIDLKKSSVSTLAGNGSQGYLHEFRGNPAGISLNSPWDLAADDDFLYIAMAGNHQIWRYDFSHNIIENFAGSGQENIVDSSLSGSALAQPSGLVLSSGILYFADSEVSAVRKIDIRKKNVQTLIGSGLFNFGLTDGDFSQARLQHPLGLDVQGTTIYVADTYNHSIRRMDLENRKIETIIGRKEGNVCRIGDQTCDFLPLSEPNDVVMYQDQLVIADTNNHRICVFDLKTRKLEELKILTQVNKGS